jgi:hypothetical protein
MAFQPEREEYVDQLADFGEHESEENQGVNLANNSEHGGRGLRTYSDKSNQEKNKAAMAKYINRPMFDPGGGHQYKDSDDQNVSKCNDIERL